jgi:hypothetical protein
VLLMSLPDPSSLAPLDWTGWTTRYLLFTGNGGVGKTTTACADAILAHYDEAPVRSYVSTLALRHIRECLRQDTCEVPAVS